MKRGIQTSRLDPFFHLFAGRTPERRVNSVCSRILAAVRRRGPKLGLGGAFLPAGVLGCAQGRLLPGRVRGGSRLGGPSPRRRLPVRRVNCRGRRVDFLFSPSGNPARVDGGGWAQTGQPLVGSGLRSPEHVHLRRG